MKTDSREVCISQDQQSRPLLSPDVSEEEAPLLAGIRGSRRRAKAYVITTGEDVLPPARKGRQYIAAFSATVGAFALGNVLAWSSPNGTKLVQSDTNLEPGLLTEEQWTWIGSVVNIGAGIAVLVAGYLVDKVGRKNAMLGLVLPFTVGWLFIAWADQEVPLYYIGRFITGMAGGAFTLTVPIYVSEIAESDIRGVLGTSFQLMFTSGVLFVYVLGGIPEVSVFALNLTCAAVPLLFGSIFIFMPESPVYYMKKGHSNEARMSLKWLRGKDYDTESELQEIQEVVDTIASRQLSLGDSFKTRAAKKALGVCLGLMFFQQLSGVNIVIFYVSFIFQSAGSSLEPAVATMVAGVILVLSTLVSALTVDRVGRRVLLVISGAVMGVCMLGLGLFFRGKEATSASSDGSWEPIMTVCVFIAAFNLGYGSVPWLMVGELFPLQIKATAVSITCFVNWSLSFLITKFFSSLIVQCGWPATFFIFSSVSFLGIIFVLVCVPETKGKTLDDIQRELSKRPPPLTDLLLSPRLGNSSASVR